MVPARRQNHTQPAQATAIIQGSEINFSTTLRAMRVWAISDLHLSLASNKPMDKFGEHWRDHHLRIAEAWDRLIQPDDVVLNPGDFSWASKPHEVEADFAWLAARPGRIVIIKGNHDHWWPKSKTKLANLLPDNTIALKKNACRIEGLGIYGARGGDFAPLTKYGDSRTQDEIERTLDKESRELTASIAHLEQLERDQVNDGAWNGWRICLFHYPPLPPGAGGSRFTEVIADQQARACIYGHLHGQDVGPARCENTIRQVRYSCVSCDQIDFTPVLVAEFNDQQQPVLKLPSSMTDA